MYKSIILSDCFHNVYNKYYVYNLSFYMFKHNVIEG